MGLRFCQWPSCLEFTATDDPTCESTLDLDYCAAHRKAARARGETGARRKYAAEREFGAPTDSGGSDLETIPDERGMEEPKNQDIE